MSDKESMITDEMIEAADKSLKTRKERGPEKEEGHRLRTKGTRSTKIELETSDIPYPEGIHGEDYEFYGPQGFAASIPEGTEREAYSADQPFYLDEEKLKFIQFDSTRGRNLPKKRQYTIKAIHRDGRLVQLGFEPQIQNNAGGDPEDAIGLRRYQRKGIHLLFDFDTFRPIYCAAWGCWAQADQTGPYVGFCSERHAKHTLPNRYKEASAIMGALMEQGVTTSRTWEG